MTNARPGAELPRSFRFARNFRWSFLGQGAGLIVGLVATPILISRLGVERYGLYILLQTASNYLMLLTFGGGAAAVRYVAARKSAHDGRGVRVAARYALLFHGPAVLLGATILALAARPLLARVFRVPEPLLDLGASVLALGAAGAFFAALTQAASSILQGLQRFEVQSFLSFLQGTMATVGAAALATRGFGVRGVAAWYALWNALVAAVAWSWIATLLRGVRADGPGRVGLKEYSTWSLSQWSGQLAWIVSNQFDRVFAAHYTTLTGLTLYSVPLGLLQRFQLLPSTIAAVSFPMMSELHGAESRPSFQRLYLRSTRLVFALCLPALILMFCLLPQFLSLWLGGEFGDRAVWPARLQVIAQFFVLLMVMPNTTVLSIGKPWQLPILNWSQAAVSMLAWAYCAQRWGLIGIAWGALLAQALPAVVYVPLVHRRVLGITTGRFLDEGLYAPIAAGAILFIVAFPLHVWADTWLKMTLLTVGGLAINAAACWLLAPAGDRESIRHYLHWETSLKGR